MFCWEQWLVRAIRYHPQKVTSNNRNVPSLDNPKALVHFPEMLR